MSMMEAIVLSLVSSLAVCLLTGLIGVNRDWPDYVHVDYGLPVPWRVHVMNTIAGPVDKTNYDFAALAADLAFWIVVVGSITMSLYLMSQSTPLQF
jgi:hypothetical protein